MECCITDYDGGVTHRSVDPDCNEHGEPIGRMPEHYADLVAATLIGAVPFRSWLPEVAARIAVAIGEHMEAEGMDTPEIADAARMLLGGPTATEMADS